MIYTITKGNIEKSFSAPEFIFINENRTLLPFHNRWTEMEVDSINKTISIKIESRETIQLADCSIHTPTPEICNKCYYKNECYYQALR